ncbi:hypothetical protein C6N75_25730 [Streptomyces solincola]|uniref:DUF4232 domain-containing protein n=1 Tax=Streptomyces solincola TaxID=2100817 RepID=A0A2S9PPV4_9ACTN|nr:hypothetical protein [Streptomyces solincola]PRH76422.1 hypothetical protein C6N75_25730 [Streptomyces solincola]
MGSLRNPVGPLPSSIYWRRRAVAASLAVLVAVLVVWALLSGGGGGGKGDEGRNGSSPAPSEITPGPSGSGPAISEAPGGREEPGGSGGDDGKNGDSAAPGGGQGGTGSGSGSGGAGADGGGTQGGTGAGGTAAGGLVPADSPLPNCPPGALRLTLTSEKNRYAPGEKPKFRLLVRNASATTCKADLGPKHAVLTISAEDDDVWASDHCPRGAGTLLVRVPAGGSVTHTVEWDRRGSQPQCVPGKPGPAAEPGTYLVEVAVPGAKVLPASFTLAKD